MTIKPLYIFDLDGTIALIDHRLKYIQRPIDEQDWDSFNNECVNDIPNKPVIDTLNALLRCTNIWIVSGRSDVVRTQTIKWLIEHTEIKQYELTPETLIMRPHGDMTKDTELKKRFLDAMSPRDRKRLVAVFEDRNRVVKMWRDNGVTTFQVVDSPF